MTVGLGLFGDDLLGEKVEQAAGNKLAGLFSTAPFSVLSAREDWWQVRKDGWRSLGIRSEVGRHTDAVDRAASGSAPGDIFSAATAREPDFYIKKRAFEEKLGRRIETKDYLENHYVPSGSHVASGTSIFDPVLCELVYRWFCPAGGLVIDPFAGGSVRGIVASRLGRRYIGVELRPEQIESNETQAERICTTGGPPPIWLEGDGREIVSMLSGSAPADFILTCPPYGSLERYSDDPRDLSTMRPEEFRAALREAISASAARLAPDRFACLVVGDYRVAGGFLANLPGETVAAAEAAGLRLYNEAILVTALGSLPMRVRRQFASGLKLGKTHQNVYVFVKGDPRKAAAACEPFDVSGYVRAGVDDAE